MAWRTTELADEDLASIEQFGTIQFGRRRAEAYLDDPFSVFDQLAGNPYLARERPELREGVRVYPFRSHYVAYTIVNEDLVIVRVLGVRQDLAGYL